MTLMVLRHPGWLLCEMSLSLSLSDVSFWLASALAFLVGILLKWCCGSLSHVRGSHCPSKTETGQNRWDASEVYTRAGLFPTRYPNRSSCKPTFKLLNPKDASNKPRKQGDSRVEDSSRDFMNEVPSPERESDLSKATQFPRLTARAWT